MGPRESRSFGKIKGGGLRPPFFWEQKSMEDNTMTISSHKRAIRILETMRILEKEREYWEGELNREMREIKEAAAVTRDFSDHIVLHIPRSIHKQAARFAEMDNTSLDQFFLAAIAAKVGAKEAIDHVTKKLEERLTQIEFLVTTVPPQ
jgi:hypothetical protein